MDLQMLGILIFIALVTGQYLGYIDHRIKKLKGEVKVLNAEKEILINIIREANKKDLAPRRLSGYPEELDKKEKRNA